MLNVNGAWPLVAALAVVSAPSFQGRDATERVNLARLESTTVSVSTVNGKREQKNQYYGVQNLVDGGRHMIEGINYTSWLSDTDASHWIRLEFRNAVDIHSIMLELTALTSRSPLILSDGDPTSTRSANPNRPQEAALDVVYADRDGRTRTEKLPSIAMSGFRAYYPLDKSLTGVVGLTLVFPGPSVVEVSEIEVMGTAR